MAFLARAAGATEGKTCRAGPVRRIRRLSRASGLFARSHDLRAVYPPPPSTVVFKLCCAGELGQARQADAEHRERNGLGNGIGPKGTGHGMALGRLWHSGTASLGHGITRS